MPELVIGLSSKMYLGFAQSIEWMSAIARLARPGVRMFVAPSAPLLDRAVAIFAETGVIVCAQDMSEFEDGPHTGETGAALLAEMGVAMVELGHAERRAAGETDAVVAAKVTTAVRHGLVPLLCVGETSRASIAVAAESCLAQMRSALEGVDIAAPVMIAYEPVWAIGADLPAPAEYVRRVVALVREGADRDLPIIYGGSAGPGLLRSLRPEVDGLFLGRFAHDPRNLDRILSEGLELTA